MKTFNDKNLVAGLVISTFCLLNNVQAQSIIFSPDQWPKRWERAMNSQPMHGRIMQGKNNQADFKKVDSQGWGQQQNVKRYSRSRTPDYYNGGVRLQNESDLLKRRYDTPGSMSYAGVYSAYPGNSNYGYMPLNRYPGFNQGMGLPLYGIGVPGIGFPYAQPFFMAPGLTPGFGYPW